MRGWKLSEQGKLEKQKEFLVPKPIFLSLGLKHFLDKIISKLKPEFS